METIKGMDDAVVARIGVSEWNQASSKQRWWLLAYKYLPRKIRVPVARIDLSSVKMEFEDAGALGSALQERSGSSNIESLIIGNDVVLQLKGKLDSDFFDASGQGMDHGYCVILAWWLTAPVTASIAHIVLDGCAITGTTFGTGYKEYQGGDYEKIEQLDADCTGFETLCEALGASQVASISLKKCYLGPQAMSLLATATCKMGSVASISLSGNMISGSKYVGESYAEYDLDLSGIIALGEAAAISKAL